MERFIIRTVHGDEMEVHLNHFKHIHIGIDNIDENDDPDFGGTEQYTCSISLDKNRAIKLRDRLNELIDEMYPGSGTEYMREFLKTRNSDNGNNK